VRYAIPAVIVVVISLLVPQAVRADTHEDLVAQVQAADVLSDLLTWTCNLAEARVNCITAFLKESGKLEACSSSKVQLPQEKPLFYGQIFKGAVQFIKDGGAKFADPAIARMTDQQLTSELTELQSYNIQQFVYLNQQRKIATFARAYIDSAGLSESYIKFAHAKSPGMPVDRTTAQPAALGAEQQVAAMEQMVAAARDAAWKRASRKGISQSDFDKQWKTKVENFRADVSKRVEGMQALGLAFAGNKYNAPLPGPPLEGPPNDPYSFLAPYPFNATLPYQGPGLYAGYDTRVDDDYDQRVDGEYDRRMELGFDRRENIQISVRRGV